MNSKNITIASDHAGHDLKEALIKEKQRAAAIAAGNNNININTRKTKNKAN